MTSFEFWYYVKVVGTLAVGWGLLLVVLVFSRRSRKVLDQKSETLSEISPESTSPRTPPDTPRGS